MPNKEEKQWAMFIHLSTFIGYFTGLGFFVAPLILWLIKKDSSEFVDKQGKESVNFQLSILIYSIIFGILSVVLIGIPFLLLTMLIHLICSIIGGVKANEGEYYKYPLTFRLIK